MSHTTQHICNLTKEQINQVQDIILRYLGADELYGGDILEGRIEYHYEYSGNKCNTRGKLFVKVDGDFSNIVANDEDWNKPRWIEFQLDDSANIYRVLDDGYPYWEIELCYYLSFSTEICSLVQDFDEIEEDYPY